MNDMHEACQNVAEFFPLSAQEVEDILCIRAASGGSIRSATEEACAYAKALRAEQDRTKWLEKVALDVCREYRRIMGTWAAPSDEARELAYATIEDAENQARILGAEVPL